ncbi:MAG: ABC-F family ATP-binding cassette domain-containing protein, partial [Candidatus Moranbacteria bacterium]|nr:ABC-F family ATP-binding cassette domain-containing protein [Candidatus Moranbacteria bacterium]
LKNVRKIYGIHRVLEKVSFSIGEGQKVALVGQNGVGKSTLLKIAAGMESFERGERIVPNRCLVGYLPQETGALPDETLIEYLRRMAGLEELEVEMKQLETRLDEEEALAQYELVQADYTRLGGYDFERRAKSILEGLFLSHVGLARPLSELSGGEKRKAALAGVLLRGVDILFLDEPTNNLDLPALLWLENYLKRSKATCLIASHDRRFLDHVVKKVIEIDWFKREAVMYTGGWSEFAEMKAHAFRRHKEQYRMQEAERERLFESIDEKKEWVVRVKERKTPDHDKLTANFKKERAIRKFDGAATALQGREKRLDDIERPMERPPLDIVLTTEKNEESTIVLKKLVFGYPEKSEEAKSFSGGPIDLEIPLGTRVAFLGNNGVGKSTLLQTITGALTPLGGGVVRGEKVIFGYLMQEHENISQALTPRELFKKRLPDFDAFQVSLMLTEFQFSPDVLDDKIKYLSPGERVRLILALLSMLHANVLVLDEPTNHLDLEAIEALEESLAIYPGTILLVTHDRLFLERVELSANYLLENGQLSLVSDYAAYEKEALSKVTRVLKRLEEKHGK